MRGGRRGRCAQGASGHGVCRAEESCQRRHGARGKAAGRRYHAASGRSAGSGGQARPDPVRGCIAQDPVRQGVAPCDRRGMRRTRSRRPDDH
ncbi:hypothetical protein G6F68_019225 [Rhizopus microsporus]|nr:hypothetical protein G6F68_019225 [Rhizopus microsporus]